MLLAVVVATGCATASAPRPQPAPEQVRSGPWATIAALSGNDAVAQAHARNLLEDHGIPSGAGGSVLYGLEVPESLASRATSVLRDGHRPGVFHVSGPLTDLGGTLFLSAPPPSDDLFSNVDPLQPGPGAMGRAVDRVVQSSVDDSVWKSHPHLSSARAAPTVYLGPGGKDATAWNVLLRWSDRDEGWMELRYVVVGEEIRKLGGVGFGGRTAQSSR